MMRFAKGRTFVAALGFVMFAAAASAQTLTVTPGGSLTPGGTAQISCSDPARKGSVVYVTVTGGVPASTTEVAVQLDANGNGTTTWTVPSWRFVTFCMPGVAQISLPVK
jgi:hypothetical protein